MTTTDDIPGAIAALGAVTVAPGRYAVKGVAKINSWVVLDAEALVSIAFTEDGDDGKLVEMPGWWSPERQFAWRCGGCHIPWSQAGDRACNDPEDHFPQRVTVDLETGAEIPA